VEDVLEPRLEQLGCERRAALGLDSHVVARAVVRRPSAEQDEQMVRHGGRGRTASRTPSRVGRFPRPGPCPRLRPALGAVEMAERDAARRHSSSRGIQSTGTLSSPSRRVPADRPRGARLTFGKAVDSPPAAELPTTTAPPGANREHRPPRRLPSCRPGYQRAARPWRGVASVARPPWLWCDRPLLPDSRAGPPSQSSLHRQRRAPSLRR